MPTLTLVMDRKPVRVYHVNALKVRVGRHEDLDIVIDNVSISRRQLELALQTNGTWTVRDLGSANGTFVNGQRVSEPVAVHPGDEIAFGKFALLFERDLSDAVSVDPARSEQAVDGGGTVHMRAEELAQLQATVARKRQAQLQWESGGQRGTYYLEDRSALVGRSELCDVQLPGRVPLHALLVARDAHGFEARNLSRCHRMTVNDQPTRRARLRNEDRIGISRLRLTFLDAIR